MPSWSNVLSGAPGSRCTIHLTRIAEGALKKRIGTSPGGVVEVDFVPGHLQSRPSIGNEMWGGISLAEVRPEGSGTAPRK